MKINEPRKFLDEEALEKFIPIFCGFGMQVFGNGHPFLSDPPSQDIWSSGQSTGQETVHVLPLMSMFIGMQNSGIEHPEALVPQGHLCSGGHWAGQKAGQPFGPEYVYVS